MRVLIIAANTERGDMITMPLGAGLVAGAARRAGHDVQFLDMLGQDEHLSALRREIASFDPQVIGISVRNIDDQSSDHSRFLLEQARPVVDTCRASSSAPVILGGPGFSIFPHQVLHYLGADHGIAGEGEESFVELLRRLEHQEDLSGIPGLHTLSVASPALHAGDLDSFPFWDGALSESALRAGGEVWIPVQSRRGCPNDCSYCSTSAIQGRFIRARSPESVVEGIGALVGEGFHRFYFVDNSFNIPEPYAMDVCARLEAAALDMEWRCILYPERVGEDLVAALARAKCVEVSLGFESGNLRVLREMNKRYTPGDVRHAAGLLAKHGIRRMGFLLLGGPGETRESVEESLAFAESLGLDALRTTVGIRIYPNTPLARRAVEEGIISESDDLLLPRFYVAPGLEPWIRDRVTAGVHR